MHRVKLIFRVIIGVLSLILVLPSVSLAACPNDYAKTLDSAVAKTISAVKSRNSSLFLSLIGNQGLTLGTDGPVLSLAQLSQDFRAQKGSFCDLFVCNGRIGFLGRQFNSARIEKNITTVRGNISALVAINRGSQTELELSYSYTPQCKWQLSAISYL